MATWARTASGDLYFPIIGSAAPVIVTNVDQQAVITLQDKLSFWLGEWVFDTSQGVPWLSVLGVKTPNLDAIRAMLRAIIEGTPPVVPPMQELAVGFAPASRNFTYAFKAQLNSGAILTGGTGQPFVVTPAPAPG